MPIRPHQVQAVPKPLVEGLEKLRQDLDIPEDFSPEVHDAARHAASNPRLPEVDRTDLEFVTVDPEGSRDLDQAVFIEATETGFTVWYAIADVAAFVNPGDPIDVEAHVRGQTLYGPHQRTPLHPPELSEDAASLLENETRPAALWQLTLDATGHQTARTVQRALIRSRAQLTYREVQDALDNGTASESLQLLKTVGQLREQIEHERGGVSLQIPEQEVETSNGEWHIVHRSALPVEGWNAQISLLTGMAAAEIMLEAGVGLLRTLPPADAASLRKLRETAKALRIEWPSEMDYPEFVRTLDPERPDHAAMLYSCTLLFRGAGYLAFNGETPENAQHAALATHYAHVTAPLRRLVDRYASEVCLAVCAGEPVPEWVTAALPQLPKEMESSNRKASAYERGIVNMVETFMLSPHVGQEFTGTLVEVDETGEKGRFIIRKPAVEAGIKGSTLPFGQEIQVRLVEADTESGQSRFELLGATDSLPPHSPVSSAAASVGSTSTTER